MLVPLLLLVFLLLASLERSNDGDNGLSNAVGASRILATHDASISYDVHTPVINLAVVCTKLLEDSLDSEASGGVHISGIIFSEAKHVLLAISETSHVLALDESVTVAELDGGEADGSVTDSTNHTIVVLITLTGDTVNVSVWEKVEHYSEATHEHDNVEISSVVS